MKNHPKRCPCASCAAIAAGKSPEQAIKDHLAWAEEQLRKHGFYVHLVAAGDDTSPTGFNAHTHGLAEGHQHPDFQIIIPLAEAVALELFHNLADRVKGGERFASGQLVSEIISSAGGLVKLIDATEGDRPVLRVVLPDRHGNLGLGAIGGDGGGFDLQYQDVMSERDWRRYQLAMKVREALDLERLRDAIAALQSTDSPWLVPLCDQLQARVRQLEQKAKG